MRRRCKCGLPFSAKEPGLCPRCRAVASGDPKACAAGLFMQVRLMEEEAQAARVNIWQLTSEAHLARTELARAKQREVIPIPRKQGDTPQIG